jgi:hypothetical protein
MYQTVQSVQVQYWVVQSQSESTVDSTVAQRQVEQSAQEVAVASKDSVARVVVPVSLVVVGVQQAQEVAMVTKG